MQINYWASPETTAINRLPMLNIEQFEKLSLDGIWRFQLLSHPAAQVRKRWSKASVPGLWTLANQSEDAIESAVHTEGGIPFAEDFPRVPSANSTGVYERDFEIPGSWDNKRVVLHVGGFESSARVWLNGAHVGMSKDSRLAAEFDITQFLKAGRNVLRIDITRWSDGSYLEDIDHLWHAGISRSVKLYATNEVFIERLYTTAGLTKDLKNGTLAIQAFIGSVAGKSREGYSLTARIEELPKVKNALMQSKVDADTAVTTGEIYFETTVPKVQPWSAENPVLYTLIFELADPEGNTVQISSQQIGFRSLQIKGSSLLINGKVPQLYGINREDFTSSIGRTFTRDDLRQVLLELKRKNINVINLSHFPNDPSLLTLCDELGIYVVSEPNIHPVPIAPYVDEDPRFALSFLDRASRHVQRDIHNPSIIAWSFGEGAEDGVNYLTAATNIEYIDSSRPLLGLEDSEIEIAFSDPQPQFQITTPKAAAGKFTIKNSNLFTAATDYEVEWSISRDEVEVAHGRVQLPIIEAQKSKVIQISAQAIARTQGKGKRILTLSIRRKSSTPWSSAHAEVTQSSFALPARSTKR